MRDFQDLYDAFVEAATDDLRAAMMTLPALVGDETIYAFGIYTASSGSYITLTLNTEEGLQRRALTHVERENAPIELYKKSLRWSPCDWAYHENDADFDKSQAVLDQIFTICEEEFDRTDASRDRLIFAGMISAIGRVVASGRVASFDPTPVVGVWMGDMAAEDDAGWISLLNDVEVAGQYRDEVKEGYDAFEELYRLRKTD